MKKVIQKTNEPSFNRGIKAYVTLLDYGSRRQMATDADIEKALSFENATESQIDEALDRVKESFPKATVKMIDVKP